MISPNGVRAILFDLDGTLRHNVPSGYDVFRRFAVGLGVPDTEKNRYNALRWAYHYWADSEPLLQDLQTFGRDNEDFWLSYAFRHLRALGCPPEKAKELAPLVHQHMVEEYESEDKLAEDAIETLEGLKGAGFKLGLVTNRSQSVAEYLDEIGLGQFFDFNLAGGEVGVWKPKPGIFEIALERAGAKPGEAVYVGDNYYADVVGAAAVGILPILLDPEGLFPEAECTVVRSLSDIPRVLSAAAHS